MITKNQRNLSSNEEDLDDEKDEEDIKEEIDEEVHGLDEEYTNNQRHSRTSSIKSQSRLSTKSIVDKEKPEELAQAYLELEDDETALIYLKKYAGKLEKTLEASWPNIEISDEQLSMIKFFHSLLLKHINLNASSLSKSGKILNKDTWTNLLQTYMKIFTIAVRQGNSINEIAKANMVTLHISRKLYHLPDNIIRVYDLLFNSGLINLQWNDLFDLLSSDESTDLLMRIAAYYNHNINYDGALKIYCMLQNRIKDQDMVKNAINYQILNLFVFWLPADESYSTNITTINIHSPNIPIFDRILLCRLIIAFWVEIEDDTMINQYKKELFNLQNETWTAGDLETIDCIGRVLTKYDTHIDACFYWDKIRNIYNEILPKSIVTMLYSSDSTFEQIFQVTQKMANELPDNIISLAEAYDVLAVYQDGNEDNYDALKSRALANAIRSKMPAAKKQLTQL